MIYALEKRRETYLRGPAQTPPSGPALENRGLTSYWGCVKWREYYVTLRETASEELAAGWDAVCFTIIVCGIDCFKFFWVVQSRYWGTLLTYFEVLGLAVMHFGCFHWLYLGFWELQSCIFGAFIDCIWIFSICSQIFVDFYWLHLYFLGFAVNHSPIFHDCICTFLALQSTCPFIFIDLFWYFSVCSQFRPIFRYFIACCSVKLSAFHGLNRIALRNL